MTRLSIPDYPRPHTYLEFALLDLESDTSDRTATNALSNAKRALHFQLTVLAEGLGIGKLLKGKKAPFPQLLDFCTACGVVGPRVLRKLNMSRNRVEHDFYLPGREEVEDFVDVTELFLAATDRLIFSFPEQIDLEPVIDSKNLPSITYVGLKLEPGSGLMEIDVGLRDDPREELIRAASSKKVRQNLIAERREACTMRISVTDGEAYPQWVALLIARTAK